jgi:hypothetical protein
MNTINTNKKSNTEYSISEILEKVLTPKVYCYLVDFRGNGKIKALEEASLKAFAYPKTVSKLDSEIISAALRFYKEMGYLPNTISLSK